jgi:hypothetical protein
VRGRLIAAAAPKRGEVRGRLIAPPTAAAAARHANTQQDTDSQNQVQIVPFRSQEEGTGGLASERRLGFGAAEQAVVLGFLGVFVRWVGESVLNINIYPFFWV